MRYHRTDVVEHALGVLDKYGLGDLSMRRIATELGLQPSALYHHFANKQSLLAAVGDEILARGARPDDADVAWDDSVLAQCSSLRDAMLAYRDGAELVATVHAFGLGAHGPYVRLSSAIEDGGFEPSFARAAARTVMHFVFGHVSHEQTQLQAGSDGAIDDAPDESLTPTEGFQLGLGLILDGLRAQHDARRIG